MTTKIKQLPPHMVALIVKLNDQEKEAIKMGLTPAHKITDRTPKGYGP